MAIRRFSTSSIRTGAKSSKFWDQSTTLDPMDLISSTTLTSNQAYIELTGIPNTYTHLRLITLLKDNSTTGGGTNATRCLVNLNGDSTNANYYNGGMQASTGASTGGVAITSFTEAARNSFGMGTRVNDPTFAGNIIDIYDYAGSNKKMAKVWANCIGTGGQASMFSVYWNNTAAITSIRIIDEEAGKDWLTGSTMWLYGIKG